LYNLYNDFSIIDNLFKYPLNKTKLMPKPDKASKNLKTLLEFRIKAKEAPKVAINDNQRLSFIFLLNILYPQFYP